jgi:hypothetical protein
MLRIVPDVNVLVSSALYIHGPSGRIRTAWHRGELALITTASIIADVDNVLHRPHILRKYPLTEELIQEFLTTLRKRTITMPARLDLRVVLDDPDDDVIIVAAVEAQADYIVSGDPHLKDLESYAGIPILPPADFVAREQIA